MNLGKILLRLLPGIGPILQGYDRDSQRASDSGEPYSETSPNLGTIWNSLVNKYTGAGLTQAERESNAFSAEQAELAWRRSQESADIAWQREFEASNTQFQRKVADLTAAGLNPMMAVAGGSSVPGASVASASGVTSVSPVGANLGDLLNFFSRLPLLRAQIENTKADTAAKEADAAKKSAEASSTEQQFEYFDRVKGMREEGERLTNEMTRFRMREIEQGIDESKKRVGKILAETTESEKRAALLVEEAILTKVNADNIQFMQPFIAGELAARTDGERAQARYVAVQEAFQQGLLDNGAVYAAVREQHANASKLEIEAKMRDFEQSIRDGSLSKAAESLGDWRTGIVTSLYTAINNACKSALGKW